MSGHDGRFAPSPTGTLHLGNLRTALLAWLRARSTGSRFLLRNEDLDRGRSRPQYAESQRADLAALGLDWDGPIVNQSDRDDAYRAAVTALDAAEVLYPCYCTRREIAEAASAPHDGNDRRYPGTCRNLTEHQRRTVQRSGRPPALRLRAGGAAATIIDALRGPHTEPVDDIVIVRNDGGVAYNLAVVVDDDFQGVDEVVRGDDLLSSAPPQGYLASLLGLNAPTYLHLPLILGGDGTRLAKRHGAVTLEAALAAGADAALVRGWLAASIGLIDEVCQVSADELLQAFHVNALSRAPTTLADETPLPSLG